MRRAGFSAGDDREREWYKGCVYTSHQNIFCMQIRCENIDKRDYVCSIDAP